MVRRPGDGREYDKRVADDPLRQARTSPRRVSKFERDTSENLRSADPRCVHRWSAELNHVGEVTFPISLAKTALHAIGAWALVALLSLLFLLTPVATWTPLVNPSFMSVATLVIGFAFLLLLLQSLIVAVFWTFVLPAVKPRLVVTRNEIRSFRRSNGGDVMLMAIPWSEVSQISALSNRRRLPVKPDRVLLTITMRDGTVSGLFKRRNRPGLPATSLVVGVLEPRIIDLAEFLVRVRESALKETN